MAEIMYRRWNEKKRRSRGQGRGLGRRQLWEMSIERAVISDPYQLPAPQVFYPKYCHLCRSWHVTSKPVTPKSNQAHSKTIARLKRSSKEVGVTQCQAY